MYALKREKKEEEDGLQVSIVGLEKALHQYTLEPSEAPFDIKSVPLATAPVAEEKKADIPAIGKAKEKVAASPQNIFAEQLASVPELAGLNLGPLVKCSSLPIELSETEFVVRCIRHTFANHILLQFDCTNTLSDQVLENVYVQVEASEGFEVIAYALCAKLQYSIPGTTYACVRLPSDSLVVLGTFGNTLKYLVKGCDPNSGEPDDDEGYEDEFVLADLYIYEHFG